jgi:hypothetical protein
MSNKNQEESVCGSQIYIHDQKTESQAQPHLRVKETDRVNEAAGIECTESSRLLIKDQSAEKVREGQGGHSP